MNAIRFISLLVALFCCHRCAAGQPPAPQQPNIIVILADDLGYGDVGYHGSNYRTPHLDRLAEEGVRLEQHYVFPMCSPTRAALLSGRYASRFGCTTATNDRVFPFETVTLASALKSVGYKTALVGKWHLGSRPEWAPNHFGFDQSYGSLAGAVGPYCHRYQVGPFSETWHRDGKLTNETGHVTDLLTREAVRFVEANCHSPFFLYLPYTAVHTPMAEPEQWLNANRHIEDPGQRLRAACATHMDDGIGQIIATLRRLQLEHKTLLVFLSDNGAHGPDRNDREWPGQYPNLQVSGSNAPFRGAKGHLYEGGIRTPALVSWPGRLRPWRVDAPLHVVDWMPTLCALTGYHPPRDIRWDGTDIWPLLNGEAMTGPRTFYWKGPRGKSTALRHGDWKLVVPSRGQAELFNLSNDPGERDNLASTHPERVLELKTLLAAASRHDDKIAPPASPDIFAYRAQDLASLRAGFREPPREAAPWVFWFWWDSVLSRGEIARELEELAAAGFGGAEIRVVTFRGWGRKSLAGMDAANLERIGQRKYTYLSDEWLEMMEFTCAKAQQLGLRLAINLGQGWPPGGPWITPAHRTKHLSWKSQEIDGPTTFSAEELPANGMVLAWQLAEKTTVTNSFRDLTGLIRRGSLRWDVPGGRWLVGIFSVTPGGLCDKGDGPEVDPASREAVLFHLNHMFSRLDLKLRRYYGSTLVDVASDSWEYERHRGGGRYWSPAILDAFPRHHGYDLRQRMHALLGYGPEIERVRHDLEAVEQRLVQENFFNTVGPFLRERGLGHRPQVYGRGLSRDLLAAYTLADTPEVEQGFCLPEGPWAARTTGKPVASAEAFTFLSRKDKLGLLRRPHGAWETTPALLRWSANHFYGEGVNRIQMHSFSYCPPGLPLPGWRMYAEIHLNRNVPWWPFIKPLNTWLARQQWLLQAGRPVADALVYPVNSNSEDGPFFAMGDRQPVSAANAIDGANEATLARVPQACAEGRYEVNTVCLLRELRTGEEAQRISALVNTGAKLVCCSPAPTNWPALRDCTVVDARAEGWKAALVAIRSVRWSPAAAQLVFQHRRIRDGDIYFLVNYGDDFCGEVSFPHPGQRAESWNSDTGRTTPVARYAERDGRVHIPLTLGHFESAFFVFCRQEPPVRVGDTDDSIPPPAPIAVTGPWRLSVRDGQPVSPQAPLTLQLDRLVSWRTLSELKHYAGRATYETDLVVPKEFLRSGYALFLELGEVYEVARITINGRDAGIAWVPPFRVEVTGFLKPGRNTLRVELANLLKNHLSPNNYDRPSGLLGPVRLRASHASSSIAFP
ncbi:MAG: hypothetical protein FJ395_20365 [Verrucomicrobia bacterium]|nr:hypothetical protein [Verrucomicrobiota bacterium]